MKQKWKGGTLLAPVPAVMVSCKCDNINNGKPNIITVAWTGTLCSDPPKTYVSIRPERFSYDIIKESGEFVINLPTVETVKALDFCGVKSGREIDKFEQMGLTPDKGFAVDAPVIRQCPVALECKVTDIIKLGSHDMFIADIVCVDVEDKYVENSKLRLDKCGLLTYAHGEYFSLGKKLGSFGYSVMKKKTAERKRSPQNKKK